MFPSKIRPAILTAVLLFAWIAFSAGHSTTVGQQPAKVQERGSLYFPAEKGTKLVYEMKVGSETWEVIRSVVKVEDEKGVWTVTVEESTPGDKYKMVLIQQSHRIEQGVAEESPPGEKYKMESVYRVSSKGLFLISMAGKKYKDPFPQLTLPVKEGEVTKFETEGYKATFKTGKEEEIKVPAGKYKAIPVTVEGKDSASAGGIVIKTEFKNTFWYAPGVGVIKNVTSVFGSDVTMVLKSVSKDQK